MKPATSPRKPQAASQPPKPKWRSRTRKSRCARGLQAAPTSGCASAEGRGASGRKADIDCKLVVLGSGPGGYTAAFRAADLGVDTVLVERYATLGGVCLNVGCIPSKALLHAAAVIDEAEAMAAHGITFGAPKIEIDKLRDFKTKVVGKLTGGLASMAKQRKVRTVEGVGAFISPNEMEVQTKDGKKLIRFENAIIAAGSQSVKLPSFPWDDERIIDSTGALELKDVPKKLLVVGGGIIGLEMATVYRAGQRSDRGRVHGSADSRCRRRPDQAAGAAPGQALKGIHLKTKVVEAKATKKASKSVTRAKAFPRPRCSIACWCPSVARRTAARSARTRPASVSPTAASSTVDTQMRTNVPHIFAIGDLVGQPMLAHKATHEAKVAAEVVAGHKSYFDARVIPSVAYTDPEIAWVGVTEREAKEKGLKIGVGKFPWAASGRAIGIDRTEGFTKLLFDEETHRIVGAGIVGVHAGRSDLRGRAGDRDGQRSRRHRPHHPSASDAERIRRHGGGSVRRHDHRSVYAEEKVMG
jgi:dihydrolipoamide dehydrogenase